MRAEHLVLGGLALLVACSAQRPVPKSAKTAVSANHGPAATQPTTSSSATASDWVGPRATGRGFSVPVPAGFSWLDEPLGQPIDAHVIKAKQAGGILLVAKARAPVPGAVLGSIVALPAPGGGDVNRRPKLCKRLAAVMGRKVGARLVSAGVVDVGGSGVCQWVLAAGKADPKPHHRARGAVMVGPAAKDVWVLTCTYDSRDEVAGSGCDRVIEGWTFKVDKLP